jgi:hypothetical protein
MAALELLVRTVRNPEIIRRTVLVVMAASGLVNLDALRALLVLLSLSIHKAKSMALKIDYERNEDGNWTVRYEAERLGFGLPLHEHSTRDSYHDVRQVAGRVIVYSHYWWKLLETGEIFTNFDCAQPHAVASDQAGAVWLNTYFNGGAPELDAMRDDEKHTRLNARVDLPDWILQQLAEGKTKGYAPLPVL